MHTNFQPQPESQGNWRPHRQYGYQPAAPAPPPAPPSRWSALPANTTPQIVWNPDQTHPLMRVSDCLDFFHCGKSKFYSWLNPKSKYHAPDFPRPIHLNGGRVPYWRRGDLIAWVDAQSRRQSGGQAGYATGLI